MKFVLPYQGSFLRNIPQDLHDVLCKYRLGITDIQDMVIRFWAYHEEVKECGMETSTLVFEFMEWIFEEFDELEMEEWTLMVQCIYTVYLEMKPMLDVQIPSNHVGNEIGVSRVYRYDPLIEIYT